MVDCGIGGACGGEIGWRGGSLGTARTGWRVLITESWLAGQVCTVVLQVCTRNCHRLQLNDHFSFNISLLA